MRTSLPFRAMLIALCIVLNGFMLETPSQGQPLSWRAVPAPDSSVRELAVSPTGDLFASGEYQTGIFRSSDDGASWTKIAPDSISAAQILVTSSDTIFASNDGLWRSTDGGTSWTLLRDGLPSQYPNYQRAGSITQSRSGRLYVGISDDPTGFGGGVFSSGNTGDTWSKETTTAPLTVQATSEGSVYASTSGCGIDPPCVGSTFKREDADQWKEVKFWPDDLKIRYDVFAALTFLTPADSVVLAGTTLEGIFRSTDSGTSWQRTPLDSLGTRVMVQNDEGRIFAAVGHVWTGPGHGVYASSDAGRHWTYAGLDDTPIDDLAVDLSGFLYAVTHDGVIYKTTATTLPVEPSSSGAQSGAFESNYPNPFRQSTTLSFRLNRPTFVKLEIYDLIGRKIRTLVSANLPAGRRTITWKAGGMSSGVYIARLKAGSQVDTQRLVLVK